MSATVMSMKQVTLRIPESLAKDLTAAAAGRNESVNAYATGVLSAAVDPEYAADGIEATRERLRRAGILAEWPPYSGPVPTDEEIERAREEAGKGKPLSDYIVEDRR